MSNIKKISKVDSTSKKRKSPILYHKLQNSTLKKHDRKPQHSKNDGLTVREHRKALALYLKHYEKGVNIGNALDMSLEIDKKRSREELSAFYIRSTAKDIFTFTVKASGKHNINFFGQSQPIIAKHQQVNVKWVIDGVNDGMNSSDVFLNSPIKFECSCGRHSYFYRYTWSILRSNLGMREHRFPRVKNKELSGLVCKHGIRVMQVIHGKAFQRTFERWLTNKKLGKVSRVSNKDKASIAGTSFFS